MQEYFIDGNSFAAPFCSDPVSGYVTAATPSDALNQFVASKPHPAGIYSANCYQSADDMHKGKPILAKWLCNHEIAKHEATKDLGGYTYCGDGPGRFRINDRHIVVPDPKEGRVIE